MAIDTGDLVSAFADNLGMEQAETIVDSAVEEADLKNKNEFSQDEALELTQVISDMEDVEGLVNTSALTVWTQIKNGKL